MTALPLQSASARSVRLLNWTEHLLVFGFFGWFVQRMVASTLADGAWFNLPLLVSEGSVVLFLLLRRPATEVSWQPRDWALAIGASCLPLLVVANSADMLVPAGAGVMLMLTGMAMQIAAKLTLRRSFGIIAANRGVKATGPYRFVRHPMYAGYLATQVGFLLLNPTPWNAAVYAVALACQVARLLAEERLLGRDPAYRALMSAVRYRLVPGVF